MTELEKRLSTIETRLRNIEARLQISEPQRPHFGSKHIGEKTKEVLIQEGFSLQNSYKPKTMTPKEHEEWMKAYEIWHQDISNFDVKEIKDIESKIMEMLNPL